MAMAIGLQCTSCGMCASICPSNAIQIPRRRFWIDPLLCTECALFADRPQCLEACPLSAVSYTSSELGQLAIHPLLRHKEHRKESIK